MILLLSILTQKKKINISNLIFYLFFLLLVMYFSKTLFIMWCLIDIYLFLIIKNIFIVKKNQKTLKNKSMKMEVIAEGISKKESDNLLDSLIYYSNKFN